MVQVIEGTWEEIRAREAELTRHRFRLIPIPDDQETSGNSNSQHAPSRVSTFGKYAGILSSEDFMRRK